jgi:hypothetical protein
MYVSILYTHVEAIQGRQTRRVNQQEVSSSQCPCGKGAVSNDPASTIRDHVLICLHPLNVNQFWRQLLCYRSDHGHRTIHANHIADCFQLGLGSYFSRLLNFDIDVRLPLLPIHRVPLLPSSFANGPPQIVYPSCDTD